MEQMVNEMEEDLEADGDGGHPPPEPELPRQEERRNTDSADEDTRQVLMISWVTSWPNSSQFTSPEIQCPRRVSATETAQRQKKGINNLYYSKAPVSAVSIIRARQIRNP